MGIYTAGPYMLSSEVDQPAHNIGGEAGGMNVVLLNGTSQTTASFSVTSSYTVESGSDEAVSTVYSLSASRAESVESVVTSSYALSASLEIV